MSAEAETKPPVQSPSAAGTSTAVTEDMKITTPIDSKDTKTSVSAAANPQISSSMSTPGSTTNSTSSGAALKPQPTVSSI